MARCKDYFFGKLISAVDRNDKQPYRDWRTDFVGQEGLIILYESEQRRKTNLAGTGCIFREDSKWPWMMKSCGEIPLTSN